MDFLAAAQRHSMLLSGLDLQPRIRHLVVHPEPNAVRFTFNTNFETLPEIQIFDLVQDLSGNLIQTGSPVRSGLSFLTAAKRSHAARFDRLGQNTRFSFLIRAHVKGAQQPPAVATGTFMTGRRRADYHLRDVFCFDDGDWDFIWPEAGEWSVRICAYRDRVRIGTFREWTGDVNTGGAIQFPFGKGPCLTDPNAGDYAGVVMQVADNDVTSLGLTVVGFQMPEFYPEVVENVHTKNEDLAWTAVDLPLPTTLGEHRVAFSLDSGPGAIHYTASGWIDVSVQAPLIQPFVTPTAAEKRDWKVKHVAVRPGDDIHHMDDGGKGLWVGVGPDGEMACCRARESAWTRIVGPRAGRLAVASGPHGLDLVVQTGGTLHHAILDSNRPDAPAWREIAGDLDGPIAVRRHNGRLYIAASGRTGIRTAICAKEMAWTDVRGERCSALELLPTGDSVEIVALNPEGAVSICRRGEWQSRGEPRFADLTAAGDGSEAHLLGCTDERRLFWLHRLGGRWAEAWQPVGTLDSLDGVLPPAGHEGTAS